MSDDTQADKADTSMLPNAAVLVIQDSIRDETPVETTVDFGDGPKKVDVVFTDYDEKEATGYIYGDPEQPVKINVTGEAKYGKDGAAEIIPQEVSDGS